MAPLGSHGMPWRQIEGLAATESFRIGRVEGIVTLFTLNPSSILVGGLEHFGTYSIFIYFSIQVGIIIPTDELIFFRGMAQPPTP